MLGIPNNKDQLDRTALPLYTDLMTTTTAKLTSTALDTATYNGAGKLLITFTSGVRVVHHKVPRAMFDGLVAAESAGRYYNGSIRPVYPIRNQDRRGKKG